MFIHYLIYLMTHVPRILHTFIHSPHYSYLIIKMAETITYSELVTIFVK